MILILGGIKSGKSAYASGLAAGREALGPVVYLATARAGDTEMAERIRRHQADRPVGWRTVEEPEDPGAVFRSLTSARRKEPSPSGAEEPLTILLDCITLWLTNLLSPFGENPVRNTVMDTGLRHIDSLIDDITAWENRSAGKSRGMALIVSNQVETGLISPWPLGRVFQDLAGLGHQRLAAAADEVYLMTAGLAQRLK